ncbi:hypothetical protein E5D57_013323 [Metarhizium anisopliae]|nr:hypothetical protein E5D57_013323 [Metarhizium anisopliae]
MVGARGEVILNYCRGQVDVGKREVDCVAMGVCGHISGIQEAKSALGRPSGDVVPAVRQASQSARSSVSR